MAMPVKKPSGPFANSDYEIADNVAPTSRRMSDTEATLSSNAEDEIASPNEKCESALEDSGTLADSGKEKTDSYHVDTTGKRQRQRQRSVVIPPKSPKAQPQTPVPSGFLHDAKNVTKNIAFMFTNFLYWDMAFWGGWSYTIGSALFVVDGVFSWQVVALPDTTFKDEDKYAVTLCFFFGACFYQLGAVVAYFEAINDGSFAGSAMKRLLEGHPEDQKRLLDDKLRWFFGYLIPYRHKNMDRDDSFQSGVEVDPEAGWGARDRADRPGSIYPEGKHPGPRRGGVDFGPEEEGNVHEYLQWRWWPSWHALRTKHIYETGYIACTIQLFGVTLYGVSSVIVLPGVFDQLEENWQQLWGYWAPQVVAACCFLIASLMFMYDTQRKWYLPEYKLLAWWIGVWAAIGSVGFILIAVLGIISLTHEWASPLTGIFTIWGSGAYMISALLQWYEVVNKGPVLAFPNRRHIEGTERSEEVGY